MSGTWWEEEPERKLTGIVLPSWGDDDPDDEDSREGQGPARGGYQPAGEWRTDPLTDPLTGPLPGPLDGGWRQEAPMAAHERLVPVVPSGPPPMWPPTTPEAADHPRARADLPPLAEAPQEAALVAQAAQTTPAAQTSQSTPAAQAAQVETAAPRREFPRYIAGELVLPGAADPAGILDAPTGPVEARTHPADSWAQPAEARTQPAGTWAPQPASHPSADDRYATPAPHTPPPVPYTPPPPPPTTPPSPDEPDAPASLTRSLPGVQFTAPARPRPATVEQPASHAGPPRPTAVEQPASHAGPPRPTAPEQPAPHPGPPHSGPPRPTSPPPGLPEASVPPPPRPAPPSIPPTGHTMLPATMPPIDAPGTTPPTTRHADQAAQPQAALPAALQATTHQPGARAAADTVTAIQPAVPAVVHAAQQSAHTAQSAQSAPDAQGTAQPAAGQDGQQPPVPAKKGKEGAPHPAFPDATARTMRILPIAADLLPREITDLRRLRMVRRLVVVGVAASVALLLGWYVVADGKVDQAQERLQSIREDKQDLTRAKGKYDNLQQTQRQIKNIDDQLRILLAQDLSWSTLLASLQKAAPKGVKVKSVTGSLSADKEAAAANLVGSITLTGTAPTKKDIAAYVDTLGTVSGLANPFPTDATETDDGLSFTVKVDITKASLGGRFTSPSAAPSASGGK